MRDNVPAKQLDRSHHLLVGYRPELLHAHQMVQSGNFLDVLELLDTGVGTATDNGPVPEQVVHVDLVPRDALGQVGAGTLRLPSLTAACSCPPTVNIVLT